MTQVVNKPKHNSQDLVGLFNAVFAESECTQVQGGGFEPIYSPAQEGYHQIIFTQDYYASALHEIAHWGVAGAARRELEDYGYWYAPDGRSPLQQHEFERVEVKPQALEWVLAEACGFKFRVSADNLEQGFGASTEFKDAIYQRVLWLCARGLNARMQRFVTVLLKFYRPGISVAELLQAERFQRRAL